MKTNKELADFILERIEHYGFTPYDIEYDNKYFIFNKEENSIVTFRIKEVWNKWLFGIWLFQDNYNYGKSNNNVAYVFCQYEDTIDKFKPSASSICVELKKDAIDYEIQNKFNYFLNMRNMLKMVKYHPFISYYMDNGDDSYFANRLFAFYVKSEFERISSKYKNKFYEFVTKFYLTKSEKRFKKIFKSNESAIIDGNNGTFITTPRYILQLTMNDDEEYKVFNDRYFYKIFPNFIFGDAVKRNSNVFIYVKSKETNKCRRYIL